MIPGTEILEAEEAFRAHGLIIAGCGLQSCDCGRITIGLVDDKEQVVASYSMHWSEIIEFSEALMVVGLGMKRKLNN